MQTSDENNIEEIDNIVLETNKKRLNSMIFKDYKTNGILREKCVKIKFTFNSCIIYSSAVVEMTFDSNCSDASAALIRSS